MAQYLLSRKYKKAMELIGLRDEQRNTVSVVVQVPVMFEPMKVATVPDDVRMKHLVDDGYIIPVNTVEKRKTVAPKATPVKEQKPDSVVRTRPKAEPKKPEPKKVEPKKVEEKPEPEKVEKKPEPKPEPEKKSRVEASKRKLKKNKKKK